MKLIGTIIIAMLFTVVSAQKCNYIANSVSGMDGTKLIITDPATLNKDFGDGKLDIYSSLYADTSVLLSFVIYSETEITLKERDLIWISMQNGKKVELEIFKQPVISNSPQKKLTCNSILTLEQVNLLSNSLVDSVGFRNQTTDITVAIQKSKDQRVISDKIFCIVSAR